VKRDLDRPKFRSLFTYNWIKYYFLLGLRVYFVYLYFVYFSSTQNNMRCCIHTDDENDVTQREWTKCKLY